MKNKNRLFKISLILVNILILAFLTSCSMASIPFIGGSKSDNSKKQTKKTTPITGQTTSKNEEIKTQPFPDTWGKKDGAQNKSQDGKEFYENTLPGTVLNPGDTWKENGSELTLKDVSLVNGKFQGMCFSLTYKNKKGNQIAFEYIPKTSIIVMDNLNSIKKVIGYGNDMSHSNSSFDSVKITQLVENNEEANLSNTYPLFLAQINIGDSKLNEVIITVSNISNIKKAQWKVPIYH